MASNNRKHSYNPGRAPRGGRQNAPGGHDDLDQYLGGGRQGAYDDLDQYLPVAPVKKRRRWPKVLVALVLVVVLGTAGVFALYSYYANPGALGTILPFDFGSNAPTGYKKSEVVHILIVGIDNEEGRSYGAGLGLTDMLLYCRYDLKSNQLNMLQVPRDSYIGEDYPTGGTGKINALLISGTDKDNPINNLTTAFQAKFKLPVDHYVAMDMDALKTIVNTFGGLKVYVPRDMSYGGSSLQQGWRWLDGDATEFFVRNRHGAGFERGDIDRLDNQRHFYSALFRRFLNLTPTDIMNLLPVFRAYCNTDIQLGDMISIGVSGLNLSAENVLFCKAPGATGDGLDPTGQNRNNYYLDLYGRGTEADPGLAALLNQYFRAEGDAVPAGELLLPQINIPQSYALYPPNIQIMGEVQAAEGGTDVDVEPKPEDWAAFE
ncbi:LCP family protein [Ruminococcaceae bacterium OttesenSCG-928-A11]|nr:LCP family protein [Ruminococcaceae bacterium OttesenSCG-928-A11]